MRASGDQVSDTLLPRRYQEEIFVRAQQGNVIAALDTGSGKTYISTLLIKWMATKSAGSFKVTVFLVPKVALVQQQGEFIAKQTSLRVRQFSGANAHEMSDRNGWKTEFDGSDVFVMTAQVFLNILTHSHWQMNKVALIVFDECHHTRKNHAYNGIMREYYQTPPDARPKVFGLTASPIWNPKNAAESLATLERNLDAKVIAVKEHANELDDHSPKPEEVIKVYASPPNSYPEYPHPSLWTHLGLDNLPIEIGLPIDKIKTRYDVAYYSLGLFGAELFLYVELQQRVAQLIHESIESSLDTFIPHQHEIPGLSTYDIVAASVHPRLRELENQLAKFREFFEGPDPIPFSWCAPKVRTLAEVLFLHYTATFQGIVFVEQRQVANSLAAILPRLELLAHVIKTEHLVGHGAGGLQLKGMGVRNQQDTVKVFKDRQLNLLVATSVAEEGLDFPACDLVIRFDPVQHMVGYLQSRGRARHRTSKFVIMVQEGAEGHAERYRQFCQSEPELKKVYQNRDPEHSALVEDVNEDDDPDQDELAERERYVVPSTGAIITYNSAITLLNHLCSLIPRDKFTSAHTPKYYGDFTATVQLPASLPLPPHLLVFEGPTKRSKKEAKRAAAYHAVKSLHALNVFDDYLLPVKSSRATEDEDADGVPIKDVRFVRDILNVRVHDPWVRSSTLWLHVVFMDGVPSAGLVTGTRLYPVDLVVNDTFVSIGEAKIVVLDPRCAWDQHRAIEDYTRMGLRWCITGRGISLPLSCYLVPITHDLNPDFDAIELAIEHPLGSENWDGIGEEHYGRLIYMNSKEMGHPILLHRLLPDVTPSSAPPPGSREAAFPTYRDYWLHKYTRKAHQPHISYDGPCVEGIALSRNHSCAYALDNHSFSSPFANTSEKVIFPLETLKWALMPEHMYRAFFALPELCHRVTDIYRAREVRLALGLPPIVDDLLVQAITLPNANAGFNNQRLETFGDAVLKLCAVVHLYNKFPHRHEGQLDNMKRISVANRTLLARALERGLEQFLTPETQSIRVWRYVVSEEEDLFSPRPRRRASREIPRRSLQDCMEAILGASYATGGINMALHAGTALGLSFGGPTPWPLRSSYLLPESPVSPLFAELQETLGHVFKRGQLLLEAVMHPSFESSSYQRLEFLGDAFLDMVVTEYLYRKYPAATSGQLSWARSRAVCSPAFASVAVKKLALHKLLLINNVDLSMVIASYVPILEGITDEEIIVNGWKHDPPKALSDVFESVMGALFVDCEYEYDKAAAIAQIVLQDLLCVLRPDLPKDPVSELMVWVSQAGCRCVKFQKSMSRPEVARNDAMSVLVHDTVVAGPLATRNPPMTKGLVAEQARAVLADPSSPHHLSCVCTCPRKGEGKRVPVEVPLDAPAQEELDDETVEGFDLLARMLVKETEEPVVSVDGEEEKPMEEMDSEEEVEQMTLAMNDGDGDGMKDDGECPN